MKFEIPGRGELIIENVVMDFNGTIAVDGKMKESVRQRICQLAQKYNVFVITSDTQGTAAKELEGLPLSLKIFDNSNAGECKRRIVEELGCGCACIGNGKNDILMFKEATLSIAVLETEGLYAPLLSETDMLTKSSEDALDLLLDEKRLISGLRA